MAFALHHARSVFRSLVMLPAVAFLSGCVAAPSPQPVATQPALAQPAIPPEVFISVAQDVEPVAEALCRTETPEQNCDFAILVDRDPRVGANAFQTLDRRGRPVVIVTLGLIAILDNPDELAFVLAHEAGHHIARHIPQQRARAEAGARVFQEIAIAGGADEVTIERAGQLGAIVGARTYSQPAEIEADIIGTVIAFRAGYDPVRGAGLFRRLPEPSMEFLSTHPPSRERIDAVRRTAARLR